MAKDSPIPLPKPGDALGWVLENPEAAAQAVQLLNLLLALQVRVTRGGVSVLNQQASLLVSNEVIQLPLPILWPAGVPSDASTYSDTAGVLYSQTKMQSAMDQIASLTTKLNLILAGERGVQTPLGGS